MKRRTFNTLIRLTWMLAYYICVGFVFMNPYLVQVVYTTSQRLHKTSFTVLHNSTKNGYLIQPDSI